MRDTFGTKGITVAYARLHLLLGSLTDDSVTLDFFKTLVSFSYTKSAFEMRAVHCVIDESNI